MTSEGHLQWLTKEESVEGNVFITSLSTAVECPEMLKVPKFTSTGLGKYQKKITYHDHFGGTTEFVVLHQC